jgi:hypothetical protein
MSCLIVWGFALLMLQVLVTAGHVQAADNPATHREEPSPNYTVLVEGRQIAVYAVKVAPADPSRRWKAMDDKVHSAEFFDTAATFPARRR